MELFKEKFAIQPMNPLDLIENGNGKLSFLRSIRYNISFVFFMEVDLCKF